MKNPLSRQEIAGVALLVLVAAGVTIGALALKQCDSPEVVTDMPEVEVVQTEPQETSTTDKKAGKSKKKKSKSGRKGTRKVRGEKKEPAPERDPFADTVPKY